MTAIQRFALHGTIMNPHSHGPYVRHEDHLAAMQGRCLAQIEEPAQPIAGYRISDPSDPTIKPWLSDTPDDNGYTSEPLYAGAAPAAVAPQGEYPHLPQSVGDVTDFGDGKVDIDWGHPAPVGGTRLYSADQMRAYVDADRVARAGQPAAVTGPALALVERQALEALCAVAVAAFHAADDSSDNGNIIEVQRADFEALDAALDLLDELPDDQPGYTMTPGAKAKWALRRLLDAAPALEAPAAPMTTAEACAALAINSALHRIRAGNAAGAIEPLEQARAALAAAPQAPAAPSPYSADLLAALGQWHQRCEVMGAHHTLTEAQIAELVVAGLLRRAHGGQVITTAGRAALAAPAAPAVDAWLQPDDMAALQRFHETAEDDESYDIGKEAVARLCAFGCLQSHSFGRYSTTDFGDYLLDTWAGARTLPFTTAAEREARAAQAKEGGA